MAEFNETLTKNEKGKGEEKISSFNDSSCQCSCEIELNIFLKSKLGTQYTFQAFNKSIKPPSEGSSIDVNNLERVKVDLDPCLDQKYMRLQVVQVEEERMGRSESGKETQENVVMKQALENLTDINIDLLKTDFKACLEYRVELVESTDNVPGTGRIVNKETIHQKETIPQTSILNKLKAPVVKLKEDVKGGVTTISIMDVTDGSCAVK